MISRDKTLSFARIFQFFIIFHVLRGGKEVFSSFFEKKEAKKRFDRKTHPRFAEGEMRRRAGTFCAFPRAAAAPGGREAPLQFLMEIRQGV